MPGRWISSVKAAPPVTSLTPSTLRRFLPTTACAHRATSIGAAAFAAVPRPRPAPPPPACVAGAAAEIAGQRLAHLVLAWDRDCVAAAPWRRGSCPACRSRTAPRRDPGTPPAADRACRRRPRLRWSGSRAPSAWAANIRQELIGPAVHQHRAGAAFALLAAALDAEVAFAAQHVEQQIAGRDGPLVSLRR